MSEEPIMFRLPLSQVEGRLDPHFYRLDYQQLQQKIIALQHAKLRDICKFSKDIWDGVSDFDDKFPYLEISDIDLSSGEFDSPKNIAVADAPSRARMKVQHGDYLVSLTRPGRGAIGFADSQHPEKFIASTGFAVLRELNHRAVYPDYFLHLLRSRLVLEQFEQRSSGGNYPAITEEEMGRVLLPVPALQTQQKIANLMREAHTQKATLEAKAAQLLASVDAVMYRHLGIDLATPKDDALENRIFRVQLSAIDDRLDAPANWDAFRFDSPLFPLVSLRQVARINPPTDFSTIDADELVSFVPMESVDEVWGEISEQYSRRYGDSKGYTEFQEGDVLWAKITPCMQNGKSAIARGLNQCKGFGSTEFHVFRVDEVQLASGYLLALLRLKYLRQFAEGQFGGSAGHQRVDARFFQKLNIPLPPLAIQHQIANEIAALHSQAQSLRKQAKTALEQAKLQVERMILGESL